MSYSYRTVSKIAARRDRARAEEARILAAGGHRCSCSGCSDSDSATGVGCTGHVRGCRCDEEEGK